LPTLIWEDERGKRKLGEKREEEGEERRRGDS